MRSGALEALSFIAVVVILLVMIDAQHNIKIQEIKESSPVTYEIRIDNEFYEKDLVYSSGKYYDTNGNAILSESFQSFGRPKEMVLRDETGRVITSSTSYSIKEKK